MVRRQAAQPPLARPRGTEPAPARPAPTRAARPRSARRPWAGRSIPRSRSPPRCQARHREPRGRLTSGRRSVRARRPVSMASGRRRRAARPAGRRGRPGSSGRIAGPVPSSAAASAVEQPPAGLGLAGQQDRVQGPGGHGRKVNPGRSNGTLVSCPEGESDRLAGVGTGAGQEYDGHHLRDGRGHRQDHDQPARGAQRVPPDHAVRAVARVQRGPRRPGDRRDHPDRRRGQGVLLGRRPEDPRRRRLRRRRTASAG